ncbi:hypothetical protein AOQ84DRAFT_357737 [Glonium stellatum]|uniref:Uncharacterized protein n=1 Tax=Glonium stellatum TaxID=574774 RepID=A0A8E2EN55_9PEZI|nr:hypothetical protein AOQ84DRAFT_357737 [Glonium stellatum]
MAKGFSEDLWIASGLGLQSLFRWWSSISGLGIFFTGSFFWRWRGLEGNHIFVL